MKHRPKQNGLTLTEMVVVVAVIAILLGISLPTATKIMDSFEHSAGAVGLIDAALSSARALAITSGIEVGVRFQQDRKGDFYMIFILHDPASTGLAQGFRAYPNRRPMKLPKHIGVMDAELEASDAFLNTPGGLMNAQTFSIVFSPQGQMILYDVRVWNRDGVPDHSSMDPVFNTLDRMVDPVHPAGMFLQDGEPASDGLWQESSIHSFYIYQKERLREELQKSVPTPFTGYIQNLQAESVNPYTGQLVKRYRTVTD